MRTITDKNFDNLLVLQALTKNVPIVTQVYSSPTTRCQNLLWNSKNGLTDTPPITVNNTVFKADHTETSSVFKFAQYLLPIAVLAVGLGWAGTVVIVIILTSYVSL